MQFVEASMFAEPPFSGDIGANVRKPLIGGVLNSTSICP